MVIKILLTITAHQHVLGSVQLLSVDVAILLHRELVMVVCVYGVSKVNLEPYDLYTSFHL